MISLTDWERQLLAFRKALEDFNILEEIKEGHGHKEMVKQGGQLDILDKQMFLTIFGQNYCH